MLFVTQVSLMWDPSPPPTSPHMKRRELILYLTRSLSIYRHKEGSSSEGAAEEQ